MASRGGLSGTAVGLAAAGGLLIYAGITNKNLIEAIRDLVTGRAAGAAPFERPTVAGLSGIGGGDFSASSSGLLASAQKYIGRPYQWGGTFANNKGGDCSGLVYRAGADIGIPWARFTTSTIAMSSFVERVSTPTVGDIVVWIGSHMGIVSGEGMMLNALKPGTVVRYDPWKPMRSGKMATYLRVRGGSPGQAAAFAAKRGGNAP
jgi:hypothetical protein